MDSQNIFDVFGNQIKILKSFESLMVNLNNTLRNEFDVMRNEFDVKISDLRNELQNSNNVINLTQEIESKTSNIKSEIDTKIDKIMTDFNTGTARVFNDLRNHIEKADKLTEAIKVDKNYISLNRKKRIVGVKPSIDKHDVVIREQIEKPLKLAENIDIIDSKDPNIKNALDVKGRRISRVSKGIYPFDVIVKEQLDENIQKYNEYVTKFDEHITKFDNFEQHVKNFIVEIYDWKQSLSEEV